MRLESVKLAAEVQRGSEVSVVLAEFGLDHADFAPIAQEEGELLLGAVQMALDRGDELAIAIHAGLCAAFEAGFLTGALAEGA